MIKSASLFMLALLSALLTSSPAALAQEAIGYAVPWQLDFIGSASPNKEYLNDLHNLLLIIITAVVTLVLALCLYIAIRYRKGANPVPATFSHNPKLEFIWTVIPVIILVIIAIPSLRLHYYLERDMESDMTIKIIGHQWYWSYEYPDQGGFAFDSYMKKDPADPANPKPGELQPGELRLLEVDNRLVVPVDTNIRLIMTATDVIHSWAMPAFGVKRDAVPGRLNESWFRATKTGVFYGQCSELCGTGHGFMPIAVEVVTKEQFDSWVKEKQAQAGIVPPDATPRTLATLQ